MLTADFDYELPGERVAQHPAPRGESRLLAIDRPPGERDLRVSDLPRLLAAGDLVVLNDTRVIPARLFARRAASGGGGARVELLLVRKLGERDWTVLAKPGRKARPGSRLELEPGIGVEVLERQTEGRLRVRFSEPVEPHLDRLGHVPLPPYIKRPDLPEDRERYQTVFARRPGAIAAPTAGLHFTREMLAELARRGVGVAELTLHVGIGTFKPVTADLVHEHRMDAERYEIGERAAAAVDAARRRGGRVVAVGTTVVRALESAARATGASGSAGSPGSPGSNAGEVVAGVAESDLFIRPGFDFRVVDLLFTNFHLPRSTLLMLVAAFAGRERVLAAYAEAIEKGYRFYSYGDAMLAERR